MAKTSGPQVIEATLAMLRSEAEPEWDLRTIEVLGMLPRAFSLFAILLLHRPQAERSAGMATLAWARK